MSLPKLKVSQMSSATLLQPTDTLMVVQNGVNKKVSFSTMLNNLNSSNHIRFNNNQLAIDTIFATKNDPYALFVDGSIDKVGVGISLPESKFHVNGNCQVGSTSKDGVLVQSSETVQYTAADQTNAIIKSLSTARAGTILQCTTGTSGLFFLPSGYNGQIKTLVLDTVDVGKIATISLVGSSFNTITLSAMGESVVLQYFTSTSKWYVIGGNNYIISTI